MNDEYIKPIHSSPLPAYPDLFNYEKPHIFYYEGFWRVSRSKQPWNPKRMVNLALWHRANWQVGQWNDKRVKRTGNSWEELCLT